MVQPRPSSPHVGCVVRKYAVPTDCKSSKAGNAAGPRSSSAESGKKTRQQSQKAVTGVDVGGTTSHAHAAY
eukprot:10821285-Prorocentrum_lima.AAC.1